MSDTVLVTGGAGYIGSHTVVQLLESDHRVVILDNLCNSNAKVMARIETITGRKPIFIEGDVRERATLRSIFQQHAVDAVIHFAGLKSVDEGGKKPLWYYDNNVGGSIALLEEMQAAGVHTLVFSSSACVYGEPVFLPYTEVHPLKPINVYGHTKLMVEQVLLDLAKANASWRIGILRYFNPVGAHASGLIGEDPAGIPNNLMPFVAQVAVGKRAQLAVFGNDYATVDGTGVRDYIHVQDLARGHVRAIEYLLNQKQSLTVNLGAGKGYSVLDLVKAFEKASGQKIPYQIVERRSGDIAAFYADASLADELLDWRVEFDLDAMCRDSWHWQSNNPNGFEDS